MRTFLPLLVVGCVSGPAVSDEDPPGAPPEVFDVSIAADGTASPAAVELAAGDVIHFHFDGLGAIVAVEPGTCTPLVAEPGDLSGPPARPSGVFTHNDVDDAVYGAIVHVAWADLAPESGVFDGAALDAALAPALAAGRDVGLAIGSAPDELPAWLDAATVRVPGSPCGPSSRAVDPSDPDFAFAWVALLGDLSSHLRDRGDAWRALAWVEMGGITGEGGGVALPGAGCDQRAELWEDLGYDAAATVALQDAWLASFDEAFPGKHAVFGWVPDGLPGDGEAEVLAAHVADHGPNVFVKGELDPWVIALGEEGVPTGIVGEDADAAFDSSSAAFVELVPGARASDGIDARFEQRAGDRVHEWIAPGPGEYGWASTLGCHGGVVTVR